MFASNATSAVTSNTLAAFIEQMEQQQQQQQQQQADMEGKGEQQMGQGLVRAPPYVFFDGIREEAPELLESFPTVPPFLDFSSTKMVERTPAAVQWYIGPAGSGAPVHFHGDAWNALAHGRKRWLLLPPAEARYSAQPIGQWLEGDYRQLEDAGVPP